MNGVINVYKEAGWTSSDVVNKLKGVLRERRIGHAGTLDPDAEGVLPVCVGTATRLFDYLTSCKKTYLAQIRFGITTDTQDAGGTVLEEKPVAFSESDLACTLEKFTGTILQTPPMYSALHINGERLYDLARRGEAAEVPPREITIERLSLVASVADNSCIVRVTCSKGTYIRTLCHDIGQTLGCGAIMEHLLREQAGGLNVKSALRISEIEEKAHADDFSFLIPPDEAVSFLPRVDVSSGFSSRLACGNPVPLCEVKRQETGIVRLYCGNEFFGLGERRSDVYAIKCLLKENHEHHSRTGNL